MATKLYTMNPKACSVIELYGILDPITRDWTDGLLSNIFREINKPTEKNERKYILFDGDVDALWVENMNSVMDDNKLLTLANGERIRLQKHCALLVEVSQHTHRIISFTNLAPLIIQHPLILGEGHHTITYMLQTSIESMHDCYFEYLHLKIGQC